ncbi:MAG: hypothetical protein MJA31_15615 [Clostridia bacterium]|nr:hypothetical protein [Clostridia bacterium]
MGNIEASIKTYNRMAASIRSAKVEMASLISGANNVEAAYSLVTSALQTINIETENFTVNLIGIPKAFKAVNASANQIRTALNNAENNLNSFEEKLDSIQNKMNNASKGKAFKNVINKAIPDKMIKLSNSWSNDIGKITDTLSVKLTPALDMKELEGALDRTKKRLTSFGIRMVLLQKEMSGFSVGEAILQMSKLGKKIKNTGTISTSNMIENNHNSFSRNASREAVGSRIVNILPTQFMPRTISTPNMIENNQNSILQNPDKEAVENKIVNFSNTWSNAIEKITDSLSVKVTPMLHMKQFRMTLSQSRKRLTNFGTKIALLQKRMNVFSAGRAIMQISKLTRKMKTIPNIVRRLPSIAMPRAANSPNMMTNGSNGAQPDKKGIGSMIAGGLSSGFNMAVKGVGIIKNALNKIAPDRMAKLSDMWNDAFGSMAASLSVKLAPAFDKLEQFMLSPAFQTFMSNVEAAISCLIPVFTYIVGLAEPLMDTVNGIFSFLIDNSGTVAAVIMAIAGAIALLSLGMAIYSGVLKIQGTIATIAAGENAKLNAIMAMNPAVFIVGAVIALILILLTLIATVRPVREAFAKLAESFISFAENGINSFLEALAGLAEGILRFAGGAINTFLNIFVNPFIDAINKITSASNKIFGTDFKQFKHLSVDFSSKAESISESILSQRVNFSDAKKAVGESIRNFDANKIRSRITSAFELGSEKAGANLNQQNPYVQPPASTTGPQTSNDVTMEDQDMQMLREVAERESINSYTTMTPSVKIDVGSINENADAEKIIQEIVDRIILEMEASAKGVITA